MLEINKIYNADCLELMKQIPDKSIDCVITSPPYDNLRTYNGNLKWNFEIFKNIAKDLYRILKSGGVVVWVVGDQTIKGSESGTSFKQALYFKEIGFKLHDTMIYKKNGLTFPETIRYYQCFEYMFVFSKGKPKTINLINDRKNKQANKNITGNYRDIDGTLKIMSGTKQKRKIKEYGVRWNIWDYDIGWGKSYKEDYLKGHPAIFSEKLAQDHILSWSNENDLVLDCFSGSGTTAIACSELKRNFICIEKDFEYWKASCERLENYNKQLKLF